MRLVESWANFLHIHVQQCARIVVFNIFTLVARRFLKPASRIGNKWNDLTLLAEAFHSPEGRSSDSGIRAELNCCTELLRFVFSKLPRWEHKSSPADCSSTLAPRLHANASWMTVSVQYYFPFRGKVRTFHSSSSKCLHYREENRS